MAELLRRADRATRRRGGMLGRALLRLRPVRALGVSLAVGLVALILLGWLFGEITDAVLERDDLAAVDSPLTRWLVANRVDWLTSLMRGITQLADPWFVVTFVTVVGLVVVWRRDRWRMDLTVLVVSSGGAALLMTGIKLLIERPRPSIGAVVASASGFAFPSGHSTLAVAMFGAAAWVAARKVADRRKQLAIWALAVVLALLVGFSRLYLGVHWLSDVLGGFTLAALWLVLTITATTAYRRLHHRDGRDTEATTGPAGHRPGAPGRDADGA